MRLTIEASLRRIGDLLREDIAPDLQTPFLGQSVRMAGGMLNICANWVDDAAAVRADENAAIRAMLGHAAVALDGELAERLRSAAVSSDPGIRIRSASPPACSTPRWAATSSSSRRRP